MRSSATVYAQEVTRARHRLCAALGGSTTSLSDRGRVMAMHDEDGGLPLPIGETLGRVMKAAQARDDRPRARSGQSIGVVPGQADAAPAPDLKEAISGPVLPDLDDDIDVGYAARLFAQLSLPYRDPGSAPVWVRRNGTLVLQVQGAPLVDRTGQPTGKVGYPYGVIPRLLVTWMATEAVRTKDQTLVLGGSLSSFLHALGLHRTGGATGTIGRLRDQMVRLFGARMVVMGAGPDFDAMNAVQLADRYRLWWSHLHPADEPLWQSTVTLSEPFFRSIIAAPVPVDLQALANLRGSALRLDIYTWLTYRLGYLRKPTTISWEALALQFGGAFKRQRAFKAEFVQQLARVVQAYPTAKVEATRAGLILRPSKTSVPRRASHRRPT